MPKEERRRRWRSLMGGVEQDDVVAWRDSFVQSLEAARDGAKPRRPRIARAARDS